MPRAGLSAAAVVDVAMALLDEEGPAALTLAAVAGRAGVATPSLYKHVRNLAELRVLISVRVMDEMTERGTEVLLGRSGDDGIRALMAAYRQYVLENPHRYAAMIQQPEPAIAEAAARLVNVFFAAMRSRGLEGEDAVHATRCVRAAVHGFAVLESSGGFGLPQKTEESFALLTEMIISGLPAGQGAS
ncbi:TetR-like C-terminal domain-containing protein [Actinocorallia sp. A-T 12471]|uniref:TetR-like C-terminal domain-containing protein n=1 Tax=Actinocorallia sp. A-T 12471 TaxID=3089813 RepID=UPI0029D254AF|nr:TetR-like C-terminal domain-containing protein [Actinocorallia sp. A-T 12471]MDX6738806.1 TetR-like C-terminal domain-containing protein [Actinocorallia sp. A-T 12471]